MKVLTVEDNRVNQTIITERLLMRGFDVVQASDGLEAIEKLQRDSDIRLVLLDIGLPNKDGLEVAAHMKNDKELTQIPIIFLTAHATTDYRNRASELGINDFFTKPIDFKGLFNRINEILN